MSIETARDFANAIGAPVLTSDIHKIHAAAQRAHSLGVTEGMAECMEMFRSDMIKAGVIDDRVPPMFMTEAILGAIQRGALAEREACARVAERSESALHCAAAIRSRGTA